MWVNIDNMRHEKAPKSQNIVVGPEDPSPHNQFFDPETSFSGQKSLHLRKLKKISVWILWERGSNFQFDACLDFANIFMRVIHFHPGHVQ